MLPEHREAVWQWVQSGSLRDRREEFKISTGIEDPQAWALKEVKAALQARSADDVELTMIVGSVFGMDAHWVEPLIEVLDADWGHKHEDAAFDLGRLGDSRAVPALLRAVQWIPKYLEFDDARSLAVKAIHSLGLIPGPAALAGLEQLRLHEDPALVPRVERVLGYRAERLGAGL